MLIVAWDIETCPLPLRNLTPAQRRRYEKEVRYQKESNPELSEEDASRLARSIHPFLGWTCCISAVSGTVEQGPNAPKSWTASGPGDERRALRQFWADVGAFNRKAILWVTFNGKRFDVPFLTARSAHHGLVPTRRDLLDTYPYSDRPHADLATVWRPKPYGLEDLCEHLGVATPKGDFDGSQVASAVAEGQVGAVARYCERDVIATFECVRQVWDLLDL